jgi:amidohydrolase
MAKMPVRKEILSLRRELHEHPEPSGCERKTKEILMDFLKKYTHFTLVDRGSWFYAKLEGVSTRRIAFRADFDAVMVDKNQAAHLCGHDGHSTILAAFADTLSDCMDKGEKIRPSVYLIFQYGEENGTGAKECCKLIAEEKIGEIYGLHNIPGYPKNTILVRAGVFACASVGMIVHFKGSPSHAAYPEAGRNPALATGGLLLEAEGLLKKEKYQGMVLCTPICVKMGEPAFGVSASESSLFFTLRAYYGEDLERLKTALSTCAKKLAQKSHLSLSISYEEGFPDTINCASSVEKVKKAAERSGFSLIELEEPFRWSEDFGYYLKETKGAFFGIGDGEEHPQLHTKDYEFPDEIIETGVGMFLALLKEE